MQRIVYSATVKYVNAPSITTNLPMPLWKKGKEWTLYNSKCRSASSLKRYII